ncbi:MULTISPECIES: hypothetical protein [Pseudovibrio]|uniref:hypothetical protein n=1 Tax=Stappiaceae TaxID=2821832 RepID=UPI00236540AD|nr:MULTISPECIES: hypothetical protein [Pseudovibrio]MDD7911232.1 hypothetical protein [Pseudovibrio exalbescens]MDX5593081.1 hypothetical protein [Pseudovibrio sp. SPO723]
MTEVLGSIALLAGGVLLYKTVKREMERFQETMAQPVYAKARKVRPDASYTRLVQDPVTGKYRPID